MAPELLPWLIGLVLVILVGFLHWAERRYPSLSKSGQRPELGMFWPWCIHREGEDCTASAGPIYRKSCGPVCSGAQRCEVREVQRWKTA